jgi:hypothetical protein
MAVKFLSAVLLIFALAPFLASGEEPARGATQPVISPFSPREETVSGHRVKVGSIRVLLRGDRSPLATSFRNGEILLCAGSAETGTAMIRSLDRGYSWARQDVPVSHLNTVELQNGTLLAMDYRIAPIDGKPEAFSVKRWISSDKGRSLPAAADGEALLPKSIFDPAKTHWFHGNLVQLDNGDLLTVMQGEEVADGKTSWRSFLMRSVDEGLHWKFESMIADHAALAPIRDELTKTGWRLHGAVEANLIALDTNRLICVARVMDDESNIPLTLFSPPSETYHDLSNTISGDGMYPGLAKLSPDRYYQPGAMSCPLIIMKSDDSGRTWSKPASMNPARGCFPRLAKSDGILALSYGGGAGALRWGNFVCFSFDNGKTWTDEVNVGPFLSTGYTSIVAIGPGKFVVFFDCTPPQPWTNPRAHWVGAVDVEILTSEMEAAKP